MSRNEITLTIKIGSQGDFHYFGETIEEYRAILKNCMRGICNRAKYLDYDRLEAILELLGTRGAQLENIKSGHNGVDVTVSFASKEQVEKLRELYSESKLVIVH